MSESESRSTTTSTIVRQTRLEYEEMRRKLAETEKKLNKLSRLEARDQAGSLNNPGIVPPEAQGMASRQLPVRRDAGDHSRRPDLQSVPSASVEDVCSVRSELSTLPGSYTGFVSRPFPASTPSKQALVPGTDQPLGDDAYDSDSSGSLRQAGNNNNSSSNNSVKLLRQNQRLLSEVERLVCELQSAKHREGELSLELESSQGRGAELQERMEELRAETEAQDKALRSAEQHLSESQRQTTMVQQELSSGQQHLKDLRFELEGEKRACRSVEAQRDEAVQNLLEAQTALEDYQRRNRERMKMLEESEDHLRDSLAHTNAERDELLQKVDALQKVVNTHEGEIERLQALSAMEQETRVEMEAQSVDLRRQLAKITTRLHKAEEEGLEVSRLRQENVALLSEVEESREVFGQLEEIADHLRHQRLAQQSGLADDSGNFSIHLGASMRSNTASSKTGNMSCSSGAARRAVGAEGNTNNNGSTISNLLTELRGMLFEMDDEIKRLRSRVTTQEEDQRAVREMRAELTSLMMKADHGERQAMELEQVVGKLEADRAALARQVQQQEEELASRDSQLMTVEARLAQRNSQIIELQEDTNHRCEEITRLEKEVWKKSAAISHLEAELEEKQDQVNAAHNQVSQAKHDAAFVEDELQKTRSKFQAVQKDLERCRSGDQQNQAALTAQCWQFERELEKLRREVDAKHTFNTEMQHLVQQAEREAADKEKLIQQLETTLLESEKKLSEATKHSKEYLSQLEAKLAQSAQQNSQLESALILCRNEIMEHLTSMERTREKFDAELTKREQAIHRLEDKARSLQMEIEQRLEDNLQLERELAEKRTTVQHFESRMTHLESSESQLKESVQQLEQQLMREKGQWMMEADELERKLGSQSSELDLAVTRCNDMKYTVKELQEEARQMESERAALEKALQNETATSRSQADRVSRLEKDMRDIRVELEQKIEMVSDLEDILRNKDADLDQQRALVEQLDVDKLRMQRELKQLEETKSQLETLVERLQFDGRAKEQILNDTREVLRKTEMEHAEKVAEANSLRDMLDDRQSELEERVKAMKHLEHTIAETQEEMSQRMHRVDNTLHKYETEITERTAQIADLDDRLKDTQISLMETSRQLQQQQQLSQRQQMELQAATAKVDELENTNARQKQGLEEQRKEIVDITQDLRLTREQHQTEHMEFLSVRRDLAASRREVERLARELEEREAAQHSKAQDTARLSEELGASQARTAQIEARLSAREKQHERDLAEMKEKYQGELEAVRRSHEDTVEQQGLTFSKMRSQMSDSEHLYHQRLDAARCELEALQNELSLRRELIRNANDTICMKDHEIATLKAHLSRVERQSQYPKSLTAVPSYTNTAPISSALPGAPLDRESFHSLIQSNTTEQTTSSSATSVLDPQYATSSHSYLMSSGPKSPLTRRDLSHNNNANINVNHLPSHSVNELPMKDTWDDKEPQDGDYITDRLIFNFEKLGSGQADAGGDGTGTKDAEVKVEALKSDSSVKPQPPLESHLVKEKRDGSSKKGGGGGGDGGTKSASHCSVSFKTQAAHSRALSAPSSKTQSSKVARRKAKGGSAKVPVKKSSGGKGERGDFSHHYKDPETLVSTYQGGESPSVPGKDMEDLQQQLQVNVRRQQEIERQLRSLDDSSDGPSANDDLIDLTSDPQ